MAPLIILLVTFVVVYLLDRFLLKGRLGLSFSGRFAMAVMLLATGIAHFSNPEPMVQMMPDAVPYKLELVWFTGVCELIAIPGLLWNRTAKLTSVMLIIFFLAILPANVIGTLKRVPLGGMDAGPMYLLFRIPLQILFIGWVWYFGINLVASSSGLNKQDGKDT